MPRIPIDAMLTKFLKKDFLRTDRPALKMMGGRKNLQQGSCFRYSQAPILSRQQVLQHGQNIALVEVRSEYKRVGLGGV